MLFVLLLFLKIALFMNITKVQHNNIWVFLLSALIVLFIYSLIYFTATKNRRKKGLIAYIVLSLIVLIDALHYTYFNRLPTVRMLNQAGQVTAVTDAVKQIVTLKNILTIIDLPFVIYYVRKLGKNEKKRRFKKDRKYSTRVRVGAPALALVLVFTTVIFLNSKELLASVTNQEIFSYHAKDIKSAIKNEDVSQAMDQYEIEEIIKEAKERAKLKEGKHTGIAKGKNLVVIQVESLQNFVINDKYEGQEVTPNINKLIKDQGTIYFDNFYQSNGAGNTSDAEFTVNNALHPSMEEPSYTKYQDNTFYGLPWMMRDNGYRSWAFHGFKKEFWNREKAYVKQGFERFISEENYEINEKLQFGFSKIGYGLTDGEFFKQSIPYIKQMSDDGQNPFYAFMVTLTSHAPYEMPEKYQKLKLNKEHQGTLFGNYLQAVNYTDETIGQFIEDLKKEGLYDNTVIALYGDHFGLNSEAEDNKKILTKYLGKDYDLDEMMNIPMLIHIPGEDINETISEVGCHMDFYPTIQNLMGMENDKGIVFGIDLLNREGEHFTMPQNYTTKGTFVTDKEFFKMSPDGVFENSRVFNKETREELNPLDFRATYDKVINEINACNYIMRHNILDDIIKGKDISTSVNKEEKKLPKEFIKADPDIEKLDELYQHGYRGFSFGIKLDPDKGILAENDLHFSNFVNWVREHKDAYLQLTFDDENSMALGAKRMKFYYSDITENIVLDSRNLTATQGCSQIYRIDSKRDIDMKKLGDIFRTYPNLKYISVPEDMLKSKGVKKLKEKDKLIYLRTDKGLEEITSEGVHGVMPKR